MTGLFHRNLVTSQDRVRSPWAESEKLTPKMKKRRRKGDHGPATPAQSKPRLSRGLVVLYEDDAVVAINKPAGLLAVPVEGSAAPSAWSLLSAKLKSKRRRVFVVHRIDRFTSGVMLFAAKTEADRDTMVRQFLSHAPTRSIRQWFAVSHRKTRNPGSLTAT